MKAQPLAKNLLDELTGIDQDVLLSEFKKTKYLRECDKAIPILASWGYMCKGIVYAFSNDFDNMQANFQIALKLDPNDYVINTNYNTALASFGYHEEVNKFYADLDIKEKIKEHGLMKSLIATLSMNEIRAIDAKYADRIGYALSKVELNLEDAKKYIDMFNDFMRSKKVKFQLQPSISWKLVEDDLYLYYEFMGTPNQSLEFMDEFDRIAFENFDRSLVRKITIVLLPLISGKMI